MNANIEMPDVNQDTCTHDEWMWDENDRYCLICGKNLTSDINWSKIADLDRRYEEEEEADDTASDLISLEESAKGWQVPADYSTYQFFHS